MRANNNIIVDRLKENLNNQSGCSVLYLKSLKSDLNRLLRQYMSLTDIDFEVNDVGNGYEMTIFVKTGEFFDIGRGE